MISIVCHEVFEVLRNVNFVFQLELGRHYEELGVGSEHTDLHDDLHALVLQLRGLVFVSDELVDDSDNSTQEYVKLQVQQVVPKKRPWLFVFGEHQERLDDGLDLGCICLRILTVTEEVNKGRHGCQGEGVRAIRLIVILFEVGIEVLCMAVSSMVDLHEIGVEHHAPGVELVLVLGGGLILSHHDVLVTYTASEEGANLAVRRLRVVGGEVGKTY